MELAFNRNFVLEKYSPEKPDDEQVVYTGDYTEDGKLILKQFNEAQEALKKHGLPSDTDLTDLKLDIIAKRMVLPKNHRGRVVAAVMAEEKDFGIAFEQEPTDFGNTTVRQQIAVNLAGLRINKTLPTRDEVINLTHLGVALLGKGDTKMKDLW